jgi:hypothetical protein
MMKDQREAEKTKCRFSRFEANFECSTGSAEFNAAGLKLDSQSAWMKQLQKSVEVWLSMLPKNVKDPLFRYFESEINILVLLYYKA